MRLATVLLLTSIVTLAGQQANSARERALPPYREGLEHLRTEAWDKAVIAFQQAIDIDATFELAYYGLGRARMPQRRYLEAVVALSKSRDLFQSQVGRQFASRQDAQRWRQQRLNEIDEIIRTYQQGPATVRSQDAIRQLEQQKRDLREQLDRGMNLTIENAVPSYVSLALGSAFFRSGQMADAEREYKSAIAADPKSGEAFNNLAVVFLQTGRVKEAEGAVRSAERAGFNVHPQLKADIKARME
jgi:tetratricopeptide (TPR) repeat protein